MDENGSFYYYYCLIKCSENMFNLRVSDVILFLDYAYYYIEKSFTYNVSFPVKV